LSFILSSPGIFGFRNLFQLMYSNQQHKFHIPVMGLAYTIDSPVKVAQFGISSVISIVENRLIEMMRKHYYSATGQAYHPIHSSETDFRARRITDYLNLLNTIVKGQIEKLKEAAFETGSEIVKYFEMLPEDSALKKIYRAMITETSKPEKMKMESYLRTQIRPGSIDVNIMTKLDRNNFDKDGVLLEDGSDAIAALRGYANSDLSDSSVIFSAGLNPRLYNYLEHCKEFEINDDGSFRKRVIIKVSDYRSALIQGKYLAKKGIWVSEFRIESGLNCGGHAFATEGYLMGPIMEEFKVNKQELLDTLFGIYKPAVERKSGRVVDAAPPIYFSAQGGIGTYEEDELLHKHYAITSTGWGTPFLLVPEATTVDETTLGMLCAATEKDVVLSHRSPLGIRFHYLTKTSSDLERLQRIKNGKPGSPCTEHHLAFNTEFTKEPICTASKKYQTLKIAELQSLGLAEAELKMQVDTVTEKECLCVGLSNAAAINYKETFLKRRTAVNICPGPNIANFSKVVSLQTMTDHIYGRENIVTNDERPHMFIAELNLYIDYLREQLLMEVSTEELPKKKKYLANFYQNLRDGINYYRSLAGNEHSLDEAFLNALNFSDIELDALNFQYAISDK